MAARYRALEQFTQEDSRLQFLRILRSLPYGASQSGASICLCPASLARGYKLLWFDTLCVRITR